MTDDERRKEIEDGILKSFELALHDLDKQDLAEKSFKKAEEIISEDSPVENVATAWVVLKVVERISLLRFNDEDAVPDIPEDMMDGMEFRMEQLLRNKLNVDGIIVEKDDGDILGDYK